jgi:chaperonin GroES
MAKTKAKLKIKPLGSRVLVKEVEEKEEKGGIVLPEDVEVDRDFIKAEVVEIGTEEEKIKVQVGDKVLVDSFKGKKLEIDGEEYMIVQANDIVALVE